jgi:hypothetical protein
MSVEGFTAPRRKTLDGNEPGAVIGRRSYAGAMLAMNSAGLDAKATIQVGSSR